MAETKSFSEELVDGMDALNKIERTVELVVERAKREMDEKLGLLDDARRAVEHAQEHHTRLTETAQQDREEINTRRGTLGKLFGKSREQAVSEEIDVEELLAPVKVNTAAYLRTTIPEHDLEEPETQAEPDAITVKPRIKTNQPLKTPTKKPGILKLPSSLAARPSGLANRNTCTIFDEAKSGQYLEHASTIMYREDGSWVELRCSDCGTNMATVSHQLFRGGVAFQKHLATTHQPSMTVAEAVKRCTFRIVPDDEVKSIHADGAAGMPYVPLFSQGPFDPPPPAPLPTTPDTILTNPSHKEAWDFVKDARYYLEDIPSVVLALNGEWWELHCPVCGCNATKQDRKYIKGTRSFYDHIKFAHPESKISASQGPGPVLAGCKKKVMSVEDVMKLRDGVAGAKEVKKIYAKKVKDAGPPVIPEVDGPAVHHHLGSGKEEQQEFTMSKTDASSGLRRRARESDADQSNAWKRPQVSMGSLVAYSDSDDGESGDAGGDIMEE
ncbi:hypothetical protein LTR85_004624 [Meristemomyces frigidus]|nr:hypothetical protein LTR85_004624 [Meristemomyces frigidus]